LTNRIEGRLNQEGTLRGLEAVSPGRNIQLIPYVFARAFEVLDDSNPSDAFFVEDSFDPDGGLDAKFVFQDRLVLDLTVNPDFSQVESDDPQITVNERFEVFFPEKRPFFLENASLFATPRTLLNTRRIADPAKGARLTGKLGRSNLGLLLIDDEEPGAFLDPMDPDFGKAATIGVVRIDRDVGKQSRVGGFYSLRKFSGEENRVASLDTRLRLGKFWTVTAQAASSSDRAADGTVRRDPLYDLSVVRENRNTFAHVHFREVGADFDAPLGFIPRTGFRELPTREAYTWWNQGDRLLKVESSVFYEQIDDPDGLRLDRMTRLRLEAEFVGQTEIDLFVRSGRERVDGIDYPVNSVGFSVESRPFNAVGGNLQLESRRGINFSPAPGVVDRSVDGLRGSLGVNLRLFHRMQIDNSLIYNRLEERANGDKVLSNMIARSRWNWAFDLKSSLRFIAQWQNVLGEPTLTSQERRKTLNLDILYRWQRNPWTALYVGANTNRRNIDLFDTPPTMSVMSLETLELTDSWQIFVKMSWLLRF
jgi:hypothetical protein